MMNFFSCLIKLVSGEWLLTNSTRPNGGDIVVIRALIISFFLFAIALLIQQVTDPSKCLCWSSVDFFLAVSKSIPTFGAIFAACYLALYSRFSSQWTYLANVYNQIKAAETSAETDKKILIAEWKAGFIEDALTLHLAYKPIFSATINVWGRDESVAEAFEKYSYKKASKACHQFNQAMVPAR